VVRIRTAVGLPGAIGTEHAQHCPAWHRQVDTAQRVHVTERFGQALDEDRELLADLVEL